MGLSCVSLDVPGSPDIGVIVLCYLSSLMSLTNVIHFQFVKLFLIVSVGLIFQLLSMSQLKLEVPF